MSCTQNIQLVNNSVFVLKESPCPRGPICKSLSMFLDHRDYSQKLSILCIMWSMNSIFATLHEVTVKNGLLADISMYQ